MVLVLRPFLCRASMVVVVVLAVAVAMVEVAVEVVVEPRRILLPGRLPPRRLRRRRRLTTKEIPLNHSTPPLQCHLKLAVAVVVATSNSRVLPRRLVSREDTVTSTPPPLLLLLVMAEHLPPATLVAQCVPPPTPRQVNTLHLGAMVLVELVWGHPSRVPIASPLHPRILPRCRAPLLPSTLHLLVIAAILEAPAREQGEAGTLRAAQQVMCKTPRATRRAVVVGVVIRRVALLRTRKRCRVVTPMIRTRNPLRPPAARENITQVVILTGSISLLRFLEPLKIRV